LGPCGMTGMVRTGGRLFQSIDFIISIDAIYRLGKTAEERE
jgi:hypothetical protein